ncbi:MAG: aspartate--tRNA(Asn) ligase [Candidatus Dojkabacteria bacterium]
MEKRVMVNELPAKVGEEVVLGGWMHRFRNLGKVAFVVLRDRTGLVQCVLDDTLIDTVKDLQVESVLRITGKVVESPKKDSVEIQVTKIKVESAVTDMIPVEINKEEVDAHMETIIDHRPVTLRHEKQKAIFAVQAGILNAFRNAMVRRGFTEFRTPALMGAPSESGASVFEVKYYQDKAYLAQSPQVYKQIMVGVFERVFTIAPVFRAEKHNTSRHIMELTQLDGEMGFIDSYDEALQVVEGVVRDILGYLAEHHSEELALWSVELPRLPEGAFPRIKVREALELIEKSTGKPAQREELDLDPDDEREIAAWAREEHASDFLWLLNFKKDKNFYTWNDTEQPEESLSFDLECRGLEWLSGTHRIHDYEVLLERMKDQGLTLDTYAHYLEAFKYGIPSEAGFSLGLERMTMQILELKNIREATLFPSDLDRIAGQRISEMRDKE